MINICDVCKNELQNILNFKSSPYGDNFFESKKNSLNAKKYPINLLFCEKCSFLTIKEKFNNEITAKSSLYTNDVSDGLVEKYIWIAKKILKKYPIKSVLDINSNDGSFLNYFSQKSIITLGIEPNIYSYSKSKEIGIETINSYFDENIIRKLDGRTFDLISVNYIFANVYNINKFLKNISILLAKNGKLLITTGYHPEQFEQGMLDYVYHEHYHYFNVKSMNQLLANHDFYIEEIIPISTKISSRCFVASKKILSEKKEPKKLVKDLIKREEIKGFNNKNKIIRLKNFYDKELNDISNKLINYKKMGKKIIGFGASLSTSILLFESGIGNLIDEIIDDNNIKWNLFCPGFGIKVFNPREKFNDQNLVIVILAWQHSKNIYTKYSKYFLDAKWVIPFS